MVMDLVDTTPFQRLRRIRQLGPAYLTFHSAESSRFTHSLGVFHLARRAFDRMLALAPDLEQHRGLLYGAASSMTSAMAPEPHRRRDVRPAPRTMVSTGDHHPQIRDCLEAMDPAQQKRWRIFCGLSHTP